MKLKLTDKVTVKLTEHGADTYNAYVGNSTYFHESGHIIELKLWEFMSIFPILSDAFDEPSFENNEIDISNVLHEGDPSEKMDWYDKLKDQTKMRMYISHNGMWLELDDLNPDMQFDVYILSRLEYIRIFDVKLVDINMWLDGYEIDDKYTFSFKRMNKNSPVSSVSGLEDADKSFEINYASIYPLKGALEIEISKDVSPD